jgi:hypothetical protein
MQGNRESDSLNYSDLMLLSAIIPIVGLVVGTVYFFTDRPRQGGILLAVAAVSALLYLAIFMR